EKLWPVPWLFVSTALVIPASLLVFLPINQTVGVVVAIVLYLGCVGLLILASPVIEVTGGEFVAGRARVPLSIVGAATAHRGDDATLERGQKLDARAWLLIRGWVDPVVRVHLTDPKDPTPYWLVSSRHPEALVAALEKLRQRTPDK
ncbi:MAG: DUF3093 domain-containing protein, partial [Rhodoglobus sp.]